METKDISNLIEKWKALKAAVKDGNIIAVEFKYAEGESPGTVSKTIEGLEEFLQMKKAMEDNFISMDMITGEVKELAEKWNKFKSFENDKS